MFSLDLRNSLLACSLGGLDHADVELRGDDTELWLALSGGYQVLIFLCGIELKCL